MGTTDQVLDADKLLEGVGDGENDKLTDKLTDVVIDVEGTRD